MRETLTLIPGHWYWTAGGHRAIVLSDGGATCYGVVLHGRSWVGGMWSTDGDSLDSLHNSKSLVAHHGPNMPETATRPEQNPNSVPQNFVPWNDTDDLLGRRIRNKQCPTTRALISQQASGVVYIGRAFRGLLGLSYEDLLRDWEWLHDKGVRPCGHPIFSLPEA